MSGKIGMTLSTDSARPDGGWVGLPHHRAMRRGPGGRAPWLSPAVIAVIAVAAAIVAAAVVAGCAPGNDVHGVTLAPTPAATASTPTAPGTPTGSSPAPVPTVPADVARTGRNLLRAGEKPPVMPLAATGHTSGGALAFALFFMGTADWGYATSDPAYPNHYFQPTCLECLNLRTALNTAKDRTGYYRGSRATVTDANPGAIGGPHGAEFSAVLHMNVTSWELLDRTGRSIGAGEPLKNVKEEIWVVWKVSGWPVVDMQTTLP